MTNPSPRSCQLLSHLPFLPSPPLLFPPSDFPSTLPPPPCDVFPVPSLVGSVHVDSSLSLQTRDSISAGVPSHLPNPPHHSLEWRKAAKRPRTNSFVTKNSQVLKMRGMQLVNTITETFLLSLLYSYIYVCIYVCMYVLYVCMYWKVIGLLHAVLLPLLILCIRLKVSLLSLPLPLS